MDLDNIRREYLTGGLRRNDLKYSPFEQFELWMEQALKSQIPDPTAMTLATVNSEGQASQRIVLLKHFDAEGLVFYTNYGSRKARDMAVQNRVSIHFPWHAMERQVHIRGIAAKVSAMETLKYFLSRPRDSQIAAWTSQQSAPINSRKALMMQFESIKQKFSKGEVPLPDHWGGYRVKPEYFEFWQGGGARLHDRFSYTLSSASPKPSESAAWQISRLAP